MATRVALACVLAISPCPPVAPSPHGVAPEMKSAGTELVASSPATLAAAQPEPLLLVDGAPAPVFSVNSAQGFLRADGAPPPEPELYPTDAMLAALRECESSNRYDINTGNGYRGAVQWLQSTWNAAVAMAGRHDLVGVSVERVSPADQDEITRFWWNHSNPRTQWPVCSYVAMRAA